MRGIRDITRGDWRMVELDMRRGAPLASSIVRLEDAFFELAWQFNELAKQFRDELTWQDLPLLQLRMTPMDWLSEEREPDEICPDSFTWKPRSFASERAAIWRPRFRDKR